MATKRNSRTKKFWALLILGLITLGVLLYPQQVFVLPEKRLLVVDEQMRPLQGVPIHQTWRHFTYESTDHYESLETNEQGRVIIPRRILTISTFRKWFYPVWHFLPFGVHVSWGPYEFLNVEIYNENAKPGANVTVALPDEIVYKKAKSQGW